MKEISSANVYYGTFLEALIFIYVSGKPITEQHSNIVETQNIHLHKEPFCPILPLSVKAG
jgi:hypothetical protein